MNDSSPPDFAPIVPLADLFGFEDRFVDDLIADSGRLGIVTVLANFPRAYIDPNRALDDLEASVVEAGWPDVLHPTSHARRGTGLVFDSLLNAKNIYGRPLPRRLHHCPHRRLRNGLHDEAGGRQAAGGAAQTRSASAVSSATWTA